MAVHVKIARGLIVKPSEILIVKVPPSTPDGVLERLSKTLRELLGRRFVIIKGNVQLTKAMATNGQQAGEAAGVPH